MRAKYDDTHTCVRSRNGETDGHVSDKVDERPKVANAVPFDTGGAINKEGQVYPGSARCLEKIV